jgi:acyl-CoA dehydrogenase
VRAVFEGVRVPKSNALGGFGNGFKQLMAELSWERLQIAIGAISACDYVLGETIKYVHERKVFGQRIVDFQNTRFKLAELKAETQIGRVYVDTCIELELQGKLSPAAAAAAKYWCTELQSRVCDECLQLHGGYGYILDYPVARAFADGRVQRIYGGANEIMKEIITRTIVVPEPK